jgi:hypothetical protein
LIFSLKVYLGEWAQDQPQCGEYRDPTEDEQLMFRDPSIWRTSYDLPVLGLEKPRAVLDQSVACTRSDRAVARGLSGQGASAVAMDSAAEQFFNIAKELGSDSLVPLRNLEGVLTTLGKDVQSSTLEGLASDLGLDLDQPLSFPEVIDLAGFIGSVESFA